MNAINKTARPSLAPRDIAQGWYALRLAGLVLALGDQRLLETTHKALPDPRACRQISQMTVEARWIAARKLRAVLS